MSKLFSFQLPNGLEVVALPLDEVEYVATQLVIRGGIVNDREDQDGLSLVLAELTSRGAEGMDAKSLAKAFDEEGIRHSESASLYHYGYRASFLPEKFEKALRLMKAQVVNPDFPQDAVEPIKSVFLQDIKSLKENPARWAISELRRRYFPKPFNRSGSGTIQGVSGITVQDLKSAWKERFGPKNSIISIAGKFTEEQCRKIIQETFGEWKGSTKEIPAFTDFPEKSEVYLEAPGAQQQLVLSYASAPFGSKEYYTAKVFTQILSGGMFGRLFLEVREKRGLCYSVFAQHSSRLEYGAITIYAGTTPERVHETFSVIEEVMNDPLHELSEDEIQRAKANLVSQIVLSEESTASQAYSNASDWLLLGRIRTLREVKEGIMAVDNNDLKDFVSTYPYRDISKLTLGEKNFQAWEEQNE